MIRKVRPDDARKITGIYNHYVENTTVTFETSPVSTEEMRNRISEISGKYPYLVYEQSGTVIGYCYASLWKKKEAYGSTIESTIYMEMSCQGQGVGSKLMKKLIDELKERSYHAVIACITIPNPASVKLHEKFGFGQVSEFREVGYKFNQWLNVGDWELLL